jgi:ketosteroid isomerase-like protein
MKKLLLLLVLPLSFAFAGPDRCPKPCEKPISRNQAYKIVKEYLVDFACNGDFKALRRSTSNDMVYNYMGVSWVETWADAIAYYPVYANAFPNMNNAIDVFVFDGEYCAVATTGTGHFTGVFQEWGWPKGFQGNGAAMRAYEGSINYVFRIKNGKIVELWETWNEERFYNFIRANGTELP